MIRIFVAYPVKNDLAKSFLQLPAKNSSIKNIRWTPEDNLHITLFFIGEIEENNLESVKAILKETLRDCRSFDLEFENIIFKGKRNSSMIWAAFKKEKSFSELSARIYKAVNDLMTIVPNHLDPIPHCTLARLKQEAEPSAIDTTVNFEFSSIHIDGAELWKTVQTKEGVKYECLEKYEFIFTVPT